MWKQREMMMSYLDYKSGFAGNSYFRLDVVVLHQFLIHINLRFSLACCRFFIFSIQIPLSCHPHSFNKRKSKIYYCTVLKIVESRFIFFFFYLHVQIGKFAFMPDIK